MYITALVILRFGRSFATRGALVLNLRMWFRSQAKDMVIDQRYTREDR